jgi:hypothetical protein
VIGQLPALLATLVVGASDAPAPTPPPPQPPEVTVTGTQPDDLPMTISWNAPDECPGIAELKAEIRRVAGQVPPPSERLSADVTVKRGPGNGWLLTLVTKAGERAGERRLAGSDCAELMHAAALVLALMINPQASVAAPPPPPSPPPPPPPPPPPVEPERHFAVGADVVVGNGALPGVAPGLGLRFAAGGSALSAELRASLWASRSTASTTDANAGGSFYLADGSVAGCARARRDRLLSPGACVGVSLVRLHGTGYGVTDPGTASAWWTAGLAEVSLRLAISPANAVRLAAQLVVPLGNPNFELAGLGHVFQPAAIWLRGTLGWELHF